MLYLKITNKPQKNEFSHFQVAINASIKKRNIRDVGFWPHKVVENVSLFVSCFSSCIISLMRALGAVFKLWIQTDEADFKDWMSFLPSIHIF